MQRQMVWFLIVALLVGVVLAGFLPVSYERIITEGTDSYSTHYPLFGARHRTQDVTLHHDITGVGVLVVNLRKADRLSPVIVAVRDRDGNELGKGIVAPEDIRDDMMSWVALHTIIPRETEDIIIDVSVPEATEKNPVGVRFEGEGEHRLAVGVRERMPLYGRLQIWAKAHPEAVSRLTFGLSVALVVAVVGMISMETSLLERKRAWVISLILLTLFAGLLRWPILEKVEGVFGGDAYNHLLKTRAWLEGDDPFSSDFRKGPFFSILLAPGLATADPLLWGRWMALLSSVAAVVLIAVVARGLSLPPAAALLCGALLAVMREFRFEAVHSLSNMTFAALVVATTAAFLYSQRAKGAYLLSVLGGLTALTRYEGLLVPAFFLPVVWFSRRFSGRFVMYTLLPLGILLAVPFLLWPITGQIGVRTPADIKGDGGLSLALSAYEFRINALELKTILGLEWFLSPTGGRQLYMLGIGVVVGVVLGFCRRRWPHVWRTMLAAAPWAALVWVMAVVVHDFQDTLKLLMLGMTLFSGAGGGWLMVTRPRWGVPIVLMVLAQGIVVTAILPKSRYYIHLIPFLALGVGTLIAGVTDWKQRWSRLGGLALFGLLIGLVWYNANDALSGMISDYNSKAYQSAIMERAAKFLGSRDGGVALFADDLAFRIYIGDDRLRLPPWRASAAKVSNDEELRWIHDAEAQYVVETTFSPMFPVVRERPELFEEVGKFTSQYHDGEAVVYKVK